MCCKVSANAEIALNDGGYSILFCIRFVRSIRDKVLYRSNYRRNVHGDRNKDEFWKDQKLYDQFLHYEGQMVYDDIVSGKDVR